MKNLFFTLTITSCFLLFTGFAFYNDCIFYFPNEEGTELELTDYNKKGKVTGVMKHKVLSKTISGSDLSIQASFQNFEDHKQEEPISTGTYEVKCESGVFKFKFGSISPLGNKTPTMNNNNNLHMKLDGDFIEIPANPSAGQNLGGGTMNLHFLTDTGDEVPIMKISATMSNRKVEGIENLTTPAGTFECVKISYEVDAKMIIKVHSKVIEWYSKNIGMVRSESYNKKGKLTGYTELTKITK